MVGSNCLVTIYLGVTSDLSTQGLARQWQADSMLEAGNHTLTNITAGPAGNGE